MNRRSFQRTKLLNFNPYLYFPVKISRKNIRDTQKAKILFLRKSSPTLDIISTDCNKFLSASRWNEIKERNLSFKTSQWKLMQDFLSPSYPAK